MVNRIIRTLYIFLIQPSYFLGERLLFVKKTSHNVTSSKLVLNLFQYVSERAELRPETKNKYSAACLPDYDRPMPVQLGLSCGETILNPSVRLGRAGDQNLKCETVMIWRTVHLHLLKE